MSLYTIALFLHVMGALGMFGALGIEWAAAGPLQRATDVAQYRPWIRVLRSMRRVAGPSAVTLLVTGIYMVATTSSGSQPWIGRGLLGLVFLALLGGGVTGRRSPATSMPLRRRAIRSAPASKTRCSSSPCVSGRRWPRE